MKVVYACTIAGSDPSGGAGIQVDLRTLASLGIWGLSVITALTAQSPSAVRRVEPVPPPMIASQCEALLEAFPIGAFKTGMLGTAAACRAVADLLPGDIPLVIDPVMVATSGGRLLDEDAVEAMIEHLLPRATLLVPNLDEAEVLTGRPVRDLQEMREVGEALRALGAGAVLVKGGHAAGPEAVDLLVDGAGAHPFSAPRLPFEVHGSGCCLSAAIAGGLALGLPLREAVALGKNVVSGAIAASIPAPDGRRMANPRPVHSPPCGCFPPPGSP
ncbi:MAG TPA: bifunctional hydroxymethylpyrimidine kinase/phosphomethylpyrimidine kinase [Methanoregulaceae archaeon]|nr:bifunctional hydroxymethylpyrimidine kinase/phosphomethylpyrimidine kinase [Methanoregulaceae archaeon]